jgi:hypothetical protein
MNQELWRKVEELFHEALERAPEARHEFLDATCSGDTGLRRQVELLLAKEEQAGSFLERPALASTTVTQTVTVPLLGRQFGPYRIVSPLGAGGMGEVYRAHDGKLGRDVAIKTLPAAFVRDPERLTRFRREARTLASLNHPNIAAIYGLEESGDVDCLVLELVEGKNLHGPLPIERALDYARQVAEGLEAAHDKGIIHRDLKPANVKVTSQGRVKVLDFGLAKAIWGPEGSQDLSQAATVTGADTLTGHILGTPGYMSPEQTRGTGVDKRTDIWAFGCLLYELLTGKRTFHGESNQATIAAALEREPDWQALPSKTPAKIRELLRQCLQKDAGRRLNNIADARRTIEEAQRGWNRRQVAAIAAAALAMLAIGAVLWLRGSARSADRSQWVQLTKLPDSATQPALSADGRMLAFIRGSSSFFGPGQIYVKILPDGQPVQLTHDGFAKMSPVFSPDGARIAYTTVDSRYNWDTWVVPVLGGESQRLLRNASGLIWTAPRHVLFSEIKQVPQMGIVAAEESRIGQHDVYLPAHEHAMAHRSYLSPDGKWVLLVEMDHDHVWVPCRLVPMDGSSPGRKVGPPAAACTFAAWSPDGKWMYFNSNRGGVGNHIWRQRFPDGRPEQVTSGPTEEAGIAMAPDGRSFVTAVALSDVSIWVHDAGGDRPISLEGNSADPIFTPDGGKLCYRIVKQIPDERRFMGREPGEVWVTDLKSGRSESLAPGFQSLDYDISADGRQVVMEAADSEGKPQFWVTSFDRQSPPRQIPNVQGRTPRFGPGGEIFFRASGFTYAVRPDGTGLRKALPQKTALLFRISPDGRWITAWSPESGNPVRQAFPLGGGVPVLTGNLELHWSPDGSSLSFSGGPVLRDRTYVIPLAPGQALPKIPAGGFLSEQEVASLPGARRINEIEVVPGTSPDVYAFYRGTTHRNLYRIPIP